MARVILVCTCLLALVGATPAQADSGNDRVVVVGSVTVARGEVANDVVVADGDVTINGRVKGDLVVAKGKVRISGTVKGDVLAIVDRATIEPGARVDGDVQYADKKPVVAAGAHVGGKVKRINVDKAAGPVGFATGIAAWLAVSVSALLLGLLALWLVPRAAHATSETGKAHVGPSIAWATRRAHGSWAAESSVATGDASWPSSPAWRFCA